MKKVVLIFLITVFVVSTTLLGIGCKAEAVVEEAVEEEAVEEEAVEEETVEEEAVEEEVKEPVTLSWLTPLISAEGSMKDWTLMIVDEFEKANPHITVELTVANWVDYYDQVELLIAGGNAPDIGIVPSDYLAKFIAAGVLLPLDDYIDVGAATDGYNTLQTEVIPAMAPDGKTYAIITWQNWFLLWYRPSVLKAAGWDEFPTNMEDYEQMLADLSTGEVYGYAASLAPGIWNEGRYELIDWLYALGGDYFKDGKPTLNSPEVIEAVTLIKRWYDAGYIPKETNMSDKRKIFATGGAGLMVGNPNEYSIAISLNPDLPLDDMVSINFPTPDPEVSAIIQGMFGTIDTKYPQEVAEFIAFFHQEKYQAAGVEGPGFMIARSSLLQDEEFANKIISNNPSSKGFLDTANITKMMTPAGMLTVENSQEIIVTWWKFAEKVIYESMDPTEAMNAAQAEAEALIE